MRTIALSMLTLLVLTVAAFTVGRLTVAEADADRLRAVNEQQRVKIHALQAELVKRDMKEMGK